MSENFGIQDDTNLMQLEMSKKISAAANSIMYPEYNDDSVQYDYGQVAAPLPQPQRVNNGKRVLRRKQQQQPAAATTGLSGTGGGTGNIERNFRIRGSQSSKGHSKGCNCDKSKGSDAGDNDGTIAGLLGLLAVGTYLLFVAITMNLSRRRRKRSEMNDEDFSEVDTISDIVTAGEMR